MQSPSKLNELWIVIEKDGDLVVLPAKELYCPICTNPLLLHDFVAYKHSYREPLCHVDVHLKCPSCGLWLTFGVPCPCELVDRLQKSKFHRVTLRWELSKIYESLPKEVVERLRRWG